MNIENFFDAVVSQNEKELKKYFHKNASIKWHCTNELFNVEEYIKANCEYPNDWYGEIERIEKINNTVILVCRVFPVDNSASFHVVSFIRIKDNLIVEMDEYWSDDGAAPEWRKKMQIGTSIK